MARKRKEEGALAELLAVASTDALTDLLLQLAAERPDVRRECFDFLKTHVAVSKALEKRSEGEIVLALWAELVPDLSELDEYGGGDYATGNHVGKLLYEIWTELDSKEVGSDDRREILDRVLPFIESGNAGMGDPLYDIAYAACKDDTDLRGFAEDLEGIGGDWQTTHARRIYRRIGDREKYLELRMGHMVYGADYHDLATFYWKAGEKEKALQIAEKGLRKGKGRMDELRQFLADRARKSGNREKYLTLQFAQTMDGLTLEKYKAFKKICKAAEWKVFEPKLLGRMKGAGRTERLRIRMHRKEYAEAVGILIKGRYPNWDTGHEIRIAKKLETHYPEEVLKYYISGLGNLKANDTREEYARKAKVMAKVRHVFVDVLGDMERWNTYANKVKQDNIRRPAFQEEFAGALPGWRELG